MGSYKVMELGISAEEFHARTPSASKWLRDWKLKEIAINQTEDGVIVLASIPTDKKGDRMLGSRAEIWLYPDGRFHATIKDPFFKLNTVSRGATSPGFKDGCDLHPSCLACPENDCIK